MGQFLASNLDLPNKINSLKLTGILPPCQDIYLFFLFLVYVMLESLVYRKSILHILIILFYLILCNGQVFLRVLHIQIFIQI